MRLSTLSSTDPAREEALEHIRSALWANAEKIAEKLYQPRLQGWKLWIIGADDSDEIRLEVCNPNHAPNPQNFGDEWLLEMVVWHDVDGLDSEDPSEETQAVVETRFREWLDDRPDAELAGKARIYGRATQPRSLPGYADDQLSGGGRE